RVICIGYNGAPSGMVPCHHEVDTPCEISEHAESNVLFFAAKHGIRTDGTTLYVTTAPCYRCSRGIVNAGISRVVYSDGYRDNRGLLLLQQACVPVIKLGS